MNKMTEDNCRIGDPKVMTNSKGAPNFDLLFLKMRKNLTGGGNAEIKV